MHRRLSSALLLGAMMIAAAVGMGAQSTAAPAAGAKGSHPISLAFTLDPVRANSIAKFNFWTVGGGAQVDGQLCKHLSLVADVEGSHASNINSTGVGLDLVTFTFGPRYTLAPRAGRYALYGQALAGEAKGFNGVFPASTGAKSSAGSMALLVGGGMNVAISPHVAVRAIEADWLRTQLPNSTTNVQNSLRLGAGVVVRFH